MDWRESHKHLSPADQNPDDWLNGGRVTFDLPGFPWPNATTGPYWIGTRWLLFDDKWECVGLSLDFAPGARVRALQTNDLRRIKMGDLLDAAARRLRFELAAQDPLAEYAEDTRRLQEAAPKRSGRSTITLETLQEVARVYDEARRDGLPPTKAVQDHFGIKKGRAARWVWLCRSDSYGLLPKTEQGRARGNPQEEV